MYVDSTHDKPKLAIAWRHQTSGTKCARHIKICLWTHSHARRGRQEPAI